MKKTALCFTALLALLSCAAGGCNEAKQPFEDFRERARGYAERSVALNDAVREKYWQPEALFMFHYYPNFTDDASGDMSTAYVWPYTETVAASRRIATLSEEGKALVSDYYKSTLEGFEYYRAFREDYHAYCASRSTEVGFAAGDTYYDDNIWISREFLNAYEVFGEEDYLETSEAVAEFVWSGWADDDLGGIYWCEQKKNSRNTCSNAPASLLFARLYDATGKEEWLERAERVYGWTYSTLRDPSDGVYWDNVSNEGRVQNAKYTYNTGSMISAGVKLYELTKEEHYLSEAKESAAGAYRYWFKTRPDRGYPVITSDNPWFNVLLLESFTELYPFAAEAGEYIETYASNLDYAYEELTDGLMPSNWANGWKKAEDGTPVLDRCNVLDMAANAENYGTLAYFYNYIKETS